MPRGFFHSSTILTSKKPGTLAPKCGMCKLNKGCESPKMPVSGKGKLKTLIVAEAPGKLEDQKGTQLIGPAGQELRRQLRSIDVDLDNDCWKTNALICRPPKNRAPTSEELTACLPNLLRAIRELEPERVILLGGGAVSSLISHLWGREPGQISRWVGHKIPCQTLNAWVCPTFHPSYILRESNEVLDLWFARHLEEAFELKGRPWKKIPDYESMIEKLYGEDAINAITEMKGFEGMAAFDYETTMLKPDSHDSQIVCCSIAWGRERVERCISFPTEGAVCKHLSEFIKSPIPKIASNMKFEDRWTRRVFGHRVRNWRWDTMQAAHVLDNRAGITSIKFQAFVLLGFPVYDEHISQFLAGGSTTVNRILSDVSMDQLLLYCGLDSLLELEVAFKQMDLIGAKSC